MEIRPLQPAAKGPADWFTGDVWLNPIAVGGEPSLVRVNAVHFTPGARTAWHSHGKGQTLYVTEGKGRIQARGDSIVEIRPGDIIVTPADEWHWHGSAPGHFMTHLSVTQGTGDDAVPETTWGAHVTDDEYEGR
jgi:quercetin dioxygenase-like cupin family protein